MMRYTALGIGVAFSAFFLTFAIGEGISTGILFTIRLIDRPMNLLWISLVYPLPMLVAGILWVLHAAKSAKAAKPA